MKCYLNLEQPLYIVFPDPLTYGVTVPLVSGCVCSVNQERRITIFADFIPTILTQCGECLAGNILELHALCQCFLY